MVAEAWDPVAAEDFALLYNMAPKILAPPHSVFPQFGAVPMDPLLATIAFH